LNSVGPSWLAIKTLRYGCFNIYELAKMLWVRLF
jgi:hypothetical protein